MDEDDVDRADERSQHTATRSARDRRLEHQAHWVDLQVQRAIDQGDFDNLPGTGKPIPDLDTTHDPDSWIKRFIEREQITGVLPPALSPRVEDAKLDGVLDTESSERRVRELLEDFNDRILSARRQLQGGPPVITATRDVDAEVEAWRHRRQARRDQERRPGSAAPRSPGRPNRRWWRKLSP